MACDSAITRELSVEIVLDQLFPNFVHQRHALCYNALLMGYHWASRGIMHA